MRTWIPALNSGVVGWLFMASVNTAGQPISDNFVYVATIVCALTIAVLSMGVRYKWLAWVLIALGVWQMATPFILGTGGLAQNQMTAMVSGGYVILVDLWYLWAVRKLKPPPKGYKRQLVE